MDSGIDSELRVQKQLPPIQSRPRYGHGSYDSGDCIIYTAAVTR